MREAGSRLSAEAGAPRLTLDAQIALPQEREVDLLALDDALNQLAALDPQQSRLVELRFLGGFPSKRRRLCSAFLRRP